MPIQPVNVNPMPPAMPGQVRPHGPDLGGARGGTSGAHGANRAAGATYGPGPRAAARSSSTVPADAPAGTDPMLWSVLTSEERSFFARAHAMGQVTYGPGSGSARAGLPLGGRVDVRV